MKFIIDLASLCMVWVGLRFFCSNDDLKPELIGICIGLFISLLSQAVLWFHQNRHNLKIWYQSFTPFYSNPQIRLSIAYLFRIEYHGKYLLVRNNRDQNHAFQPVGGVYKYYPNESRKEFEYIGILPDDKIPIDDDSTSDLRINLKHRKKLPTFLRWFFKMEDREVDPWREFYEELVSSGILQSHTFPHIKYKKVGTHLTGIQYSEKFKINEFLLADIFEFLPNSLQEEQLQRLQGTGHPDIIWATRDEIQMGRQNGSIILPHAQKLFNYQIHNHNF